MLFSKLTEKKIRKRKRILIVSHEMSYTGAPRSLLNMAKVFCKMGHDVAVWTLETGEFTKEFVPVGIKVRCIGRSIYNLKEDIKDFDLVILNTFFCSSLVTEFQSVVRTILYIREAQNIPDLVKNCGLDIKNIMNAQEVICVSEYAKTFIINNCLPRNINVVHNFVKDEYKRKLNFVHNKIVNYIISGTIEKRKGHDIVIKAFLQMPDELKEITRLHIVGRKPEWSRKFWEGLIPQNDIRIIEHGEISDEKERIALYEKMNVFVVASRDEACSLVALEGAMLGKALILSENTGAKYLDVTKRWVYPTEDESALCRKMCELTSRKMLIYEGIRMRKQYLETSTEKRYMAAIKQIIDRGDK